MLLLRTVFAVVFFIIVLGSFSFQNVFGHNPDFEIKTAEDVLKFCEFFYEEYQLLGADNLANQHPNFPNLRGCVILYNHIAWNSTHQARDLVLVEEIKEFLGDSTYIKDRHLQISSNVPDWIKRDAQLWINGENPDIGFAYGVRTMLEAGVLKLNFVDRNCDGNNLCFKEGDFIKYSHFDKFGNVETIEHTVEAIIDNEIILKVKKISQDGIIREELVIEKNGMIKSEKCCQYYEYLIPSSVRFGDTISEDIKIVGETTHTFENQSKKSWLASDLTGQNVKIIDKKTGLVFVHEVHETEVLAVGDQTKITDTNFFDTKYDMTKHEVVIPEWWKTTTMWLLDKRISESEYLRALENLISRNILRV